MPLILWGFIMFLSDAILGAYPPSYWDHLEFVWFGVGRPCRDDESCFDTLGFHHVFVRCHTGAYPPSYWDHLEFVGSV